MQSIERDNGNFKFNFIFYGKIVLFGHELKPIMKLSRDREPGMYRNCQII